MRLCGFVLILVVGLAALIAVGAPGRSVSAHTGFQSSTPADGDTVDRPVAEVVITFTGEATPAGEGFSVLDPSGVIREPTSVSTLDDKVFVLGFDPPLVDGDVGVRWSVQAQDAHPISGSFAFTVLASAPATAPPATSTPSTSAPSEAAPTTESEPASTATTAPAQTATSLPPSTVASASGAGTSGGDTSLEEFLAVDTTSPGESRQLLGRIVGLLGVIGALGGLAFLAFTFHGSRRETSEALVAVAVLALAGGVGALLEYWGTITQTDESFWDAFTSTPGSAMALRFVGGIALAVGAVAAASRSGRERVARSLSAAVVEDAAPARDTAAMSGRWNVRDAPLTLFGAAVITASFWFDGHTVTTGPRLVHAAVNSVHVVAASIWAGGVVALTATLWIRHRRGEQSRAAELIVRFSTIATASLVAVSLAGALMAVFVLDSFGELTSTEWGKTLLIKTAAVGLASLGGAYNHFRLLPALEAAPDDPNLASEFRRTLIAESILLVFVTATTAWLIAAAT